MVGRQVDVMYPTLPPVPEDAPVALSVEGLSRGMVQDVSLQVRAGEILGVAGLVGSGRSELLRMIFGADTPAAGRVLVHGAALVVPCAVGHQMTLRQFEFFVEIADTRSFSRAAEAMHVSQPALSQQIRSIESQLGSPLFKRLANGVRLTQAGEAMLPHARAAIASARRGVRAFHEVGAGLAGELELATVMSIAVGVLPKPLARWHAEVPQISVRVSEFAHRRQLEDFTAAGNADLAVGPTPVAWSGPSVPIGQERFVLVITGSSQSRV